MTVYDLIQELAKWPATHEVRINSMHRDRWHNDRAQAALGVRQMYNDAPYKCHRDPRNVVEIYGQSAKDESK